MAISADLGEKLEAVVNDLVANGRYNSKSEVLREGVRLVQEREAALERLHGILKHSLADFDAGRADDLEDVVRAIEARYSVPEKASA